GSLQGDAAFPTFARFGKRAPGDFRLPLVTFEMGANSGHAMGVSRFKSEFHPPQEVVVIPVGKPVRRRRGARAGMRAARIGRTPISTRATPWDVR
ncbi:hypothetical protein ACC772_37895, partial [Rhizobium ruizarguesonis]